MYPTTAKLRTVASLRRIALAFCGLALVSLPLRAAVLIHEYALRGTLADNQGGPSLIAMGGEIKALGYVFATANNGLSFTSSAFSPTNFSLEFSFSLNDPTGYDKLIDFKQLSVDSGLYQRDGFLSLYPVAAGSEADVFHNTVHVVLTRDGATNRVTGYVNGQERFSFIDSSSLTVAQNGTLHFFVDDGHTRPVIEASAGTANYLRVFNGALTSTEVSNLFAAGPPLAIPEPPTVVLLTLGALGFAAWTARRRKRV